MANSIISSFLAQSPFSIKNSQSGTVMANGLRILRVSIKLSSAPMRHMKEDGTSIVDFRILQPSSVSIDAFCPDASTIDQVTNLLVDRSNLYTITSKGVILDQMMVDVEQIKQSPDIMSSTPIRITFKSILTKNAKPVVTAQSANSSLIDRGMTILNQATTTVTDLFSSVSKAI